MSDKFVGAHVSTSGGVQNAPLNAIKIGAKAFALFTALCIPLFSLLILYKSISISCLSPKYVL